MEGAGARHPQAEAIEAGPHHPCSAEAAVPEAQGTTAKAISRELRRTKPMTDAQTMTKSALEKNGNETKKKETKKRKKKKSSS